VLRLARKGGLLDDVELQAADSTNVNCRGAVTDTYNLIAGAIGLLMHRVAHWLGATVGAVAITFGAENYLVRSIKSVVSIDWSCKAAQDDLITTLVRDAKRLCETLRTSPIVEQDPEGCKNTAEANFPFMAGSTTDRCLRISAEFGPAKSPRRSPSVLARRRCQTFSDSGRNSASSLRLDRTQEHGDLGRQAASR
jgi:hypothetical protein